MAVGNEIGSDRPWLGEFFLLAIYDRALTGPEVQYNLAAGNGTANVGHLSLSPGTDIRLNSVRGSGVTDVPPSLRVTNVGGEPIRWTATENSNWMDLDMNTGLLLATRSQPLQIQLDPTVIASMAVGTYTATIDFSNDTSHYGTSQQRVILSISEPGSPSTGNRPGPQNTGPTDLSVLQTTGGMTITQDGTVIENVRIYGTVDIRANNVTLRNFVIDAGGQPYAVRATNGNMGIVM
ncbi:MAG: hypothetical protein KDB61_10480, partial [Planctomycetes bacterium]|nr:hypothetical protein [Planctomycetota bacterium]